MDEDIFEEPGSVEDYSNDYDNDYEYNEPMTVLEMIMTVHNEEDTSGFIQRRSRRRRRSEMIDDGHWKKRQ